MTVTASVTTASNNVNSSRLKRSAREEKECFLHSLCVMGALCCQLENLENGRIKTILSLLKCGCFEWLDNKCSFLIFTKIKRLCCQNRGDVQANRGRHFLICSTFTTARGHWENSSSFGPNVVNLPLRHPKV